MESGFCLYESCSLPTNQPIVSETDRFFIVQSESILGQMNEMTCTGADWCIHKQGRIHGYRSRVRVGRSSNAKTARKRQKKLSVTEKS